MEQNAQKPLDRVKKQIEVWANELIDLSRRNTSLYYRKTKRSTLELESPSVEEFVGLLSGGGELSFYEPPQPAELEDDEPWTVEDSLEDAGPSELVTRKTASADLRATLRNIARAGDLDFMDRGLQTIYAAIGLLRWKAAPDADWDRSPLLYIPVLLERASTKELHKLSRADEDPVLNLGLQVVLRDEHDIDLSDLSLEELDQPGVVESILEEIGERVAQKGWSVEPLISIKRATFHKEAMYADLIENLETIASHETVATLANGEAIGEAELESDELPSDQDVDDLAPPEQAHLILDADASQRAAVHAAVKGHSFVMDGPPGTGKSQTIANMVAELIAAGRSVLFVSEKAAALDVVFKRLEERGLDDFLLQLHSHKATRKEVVQDLNRSLTSRPRSAPRMGEQDRQRLLRARRELSEYAAAVNELRQPLGRPLIDVLGRLSQLAQHKTPPAPDIGDPLTTLSADRMAELSDAFEGLARVWEPAVEPEFTWRGFAPDRFSDADRTVLVRHLEGLLEGSARASELANQLCLDLAISRVGNDSEARAAVQVAEHLQTQPAIGRAAWAAADFGAVAREFQDAEGQATTIQRGRASLAGRYGAGAAQLDIETAASVRQALETPLPTSTPFSFDRDWTVASHGELIDKLSKVQVALVELQEPIRRVTAAFSLEPNQVALGGARELASIAAHSGDLNRPLDHWCSSAAARQVRAALDELAPLTARYAQLRAEAGETFSDSVFELEVVGLRTRFEKVHTSFWKWFTPAFWADRGALRGAALDGKFSTTHVDALEVVNEALDVGAELDEREARLTTLLGSFHRPRQTRCDEAAEALTLVERALKICGAKFDSEAIRRTFAGAGPQDGMLPQIAETLGAGLARVKSELSEIPGLPPELFKFALPAMVAWLQETVGALRGRWSKISPVIDLRTAPCSVAELLEEMELVVALREAETRFQGGAARRRELFGAGFSGLDTDWPELECAVQWLGGLRQHLGGRLPESFIARNFGADESPESAAVLEQLDTNAKSLRWVLDRFSPARREELQGELGLSFEGDAEVVEDLLERIDDITTWTDYVRRRRVLEADGFDAPLGHCEELGIEGDELAEVLEKAVLAHWVEALLPQDQRLQRHRARDRDDLVTQFRELDRQLIDDAAEHVVRACNARRPTTTVGPAGLIAREAQKKRRHKPVRTLLAETVDVVTRLKPCFMMSPLSVSQFLPPAYRFDVVIFDEASQVHPSDSINCIYRGHQLIVAGDEKQLPPTNFFQRGMDGGEDTYEETQFDEFESILGLCRGTASFAEMPLRWHYRSRSESLITFSNHRFYSPPGLITFPSPRESCDDEGVEFIRAAGTYRRGTTRDNPVEAERVAARVLHHIRRNPALKIGVVAFSSAQEACIDYAITAMREANPDVEHFFDGHDRLDGFFVKNLESVQGDERDIIIFSVGYGPDEVGKMTLNFGPLNREGGWRRLNVAVTRARRKVEVVASFAAGEINASGTKSRGVKELLRYLDFAARGLPALSVGVGEDDHLVESPFEQSVLDVVRQWGFDVVPQVGAAGYRIDLGVRHPDRPGEYALGIECDGAMYHSSRVARDRDRLRQQVLEGLGWRIHRIWGPSWYRDRRTQEERLRATIEQAIDAGPRKAPRQQSATDTGRRDSERIELSSQPEWTVPYTSAGFTSYGVSHPADEDAQFELERALKAILEAEAPITEGYLARRVADTYDVSNTKRLRRAIDRRMWVLLRDGSWRKAGSTFEARDGDLRVRVPVDGDAASLRKLDQIPPAEVELAVESLVRDATRASPDELMNHLRTLFGFRRTGAKIRAIFEDAIRSLVAAGRLERTEDGGLRLPNGR